MARFIRVRGVPGALVGHPLRPGSFAGKAPMVDAEPDADLKDSLDDVEQVVPLDQHITKALALGDLDAIGKPFEAKSLSDAVKRSESDASRRVAKSKQTSPGGSD